SNLAKVRNGIQTPITKVTDMPAPIYAGVANASAIGEATAAQYSLVYQNLNLTTNEAPDVIRAAFGLTQYDSGISTDSTFVGIFTATGESATFGQYIATQPLDRFNCGQEYVFTLDDTLVPTYGGMTRAVFTIDSAGICPDVEDYNTFEITETPSAGSGAPTLSGEDILLSVRARYPQQTTGMGIDFRDSSNIDSYNFTMITTLPETGDINDLTVYVQNGGWTTTGVDMLSRQLLSSGPNAGMVQLEVSVDYLGHFIVGGKKIPTPTPPPPTTQPPSGFGRTGIQPGSGSSGGSGSGADQSSANVHKVTYDVCNENISRIVVGHDRPVAPLIQLLSPQLGLVEASLVENQPYTELNRNAEVSRYVYEAPLGSGEKYFTIYAVDHQSNIASKIILIEGCEGTIIFVNDKIVLPEIFDFKYSIENSTIRPATAPHHYISENATLPVSAIVDSPIVPLKRAELRVVTLGESDQNYTAIPMDITPLI
ncbi:hypothetical protein LCGC14_2545470, partial [marine sediment metagenome]